MVRIYIGILSFCVFVFFQAQGIPAGDSGDLVTAVATFGVPHPPGYPLYTFIGWLVSQIPLSTISWRVGLLSSIPHALVVVFVYTIVFKLTKKIAPSLFAVLLLMGNYLFFLYSVTAEVFALFDLFVVVLLWLALRGNVYLFAFVFGLSLTHHHVILFLFPALSYFLWNKKISYAKAIFAFLAGLTPYLYVLAAAKGNSMVLWDRAISVANFIRLVTRADYGTFQSGAYIGNAPIQRLLEIQAFFQNIFADFTWVGMLLVILGYVSLWRHARRIFWLLFLSALSIGPVFLFYASFPLVNRFSLGTYERFLLPSYVIFSIIAGVGFAYMMDWISSFQIKFKLKSVLTGGITVLFIMFTLVLGSVTVWKFIGYRQDHTAENLAIDILQSMPQGALLVLDRDTVLFTTQYMRYVKNFRSDVVVLHNSRLGDPEYRNNIRYHFPTLPMPTSSDRFFEQFMKENTQNNRVFSLSKFSMGENWYWVPHGFTNELVPKARLPDISAMRQNNLSIWQSAHDPAGGILERYNHLMLSDVRDVYTSARMEFGKILLKAGDFETAKIQFFSAIDYGGEADLRESYTHLGLSEMFLKQCDDALMNFQKARGIGFSQDSNIVLYEAQTYRECVGDEKKAAELEAIYSKSLDAGKTPLLKL